MTRRCPSQGNPADAVSRSVLPCPTSAPSHRGPRCRSTPAVMIGNMKTTALVSLRGAIDFMCFPRIDSPTIFAGLLEPSHGGAFSIEPANDAANVKQMYLPDTNVLLTRFMTHGRRVRTDGLHAGAGEATPTALTDPKPPRLPNCVIRVVRMVHGRMTLQDALRAALRLCARRHIVAQVVEDGSVEFIAPTAGDLQLRLNSTVTACSRYERARAHGRIRTAATASRPASCSARPKRCVKTRSTAKRC